MKHHLLGLDVGSTTVKLVWIDPQGALRYHRYERHNAQVRERALDLLQDALFQLGDAPVTISLSGSAGQGVSLETGLPFVQEVFATRAACRRLLPQADVAIELGGEDAKILFLTGGEEERMNGSCAGGTGAFIDQMASLLDLTVPMLDTLSLEHEQIYPIASRCGVFAKSDIQPLLNQGARKADICASIYQAIVDQTIGGLAQGRPIAGNIAFLGGPLTFLQGLRRRFTATLHLTEQTALFPQYAELYVALGAALTGADGEPLMLSDIIERFNHPRKTDHLTRALPPLFEDEAEYEAFCSRHRGADVAEAPIRTYAGNAYLGIDAGSTTTKLTLIAEDGALLQSYYTSNRGEPLVTLREQLKNLFALCGDRITIRGSAVTGYGEELIKNAFGIGFGIVETTAHYTAARHFCPDVDFILDIGGQDIKCFHLKNGIVDSILLNEACSSGCGSFVESFASALGHEIGAFAQKGLFARHPVDLGSRCTVFMNSSVKQAQKEGATVEDISAGLAVSVVKNALYKVIRAPKTQKLGSSIVVQGGTFANDCVLRAFERELGQPVVRPAIAGLMGAFGAALYARARAAEGMGAASKLISPEQLESFSHEVKSVRCGLCENRCRLTQNIFPSGKFISGNRCERPLGGKSEPLPNAFEFKRKLLFAPETAAPVRERIGIPMGLGMWDNLPFWRTLLSSLGFEVVLSPPSSRSIFALGQHTIPSDTVCYPAKLMHGHIEALLDAGVDAIFSPCMTYNFDEGLGDNHYNCPVVAYYPELLYANIERLRGARFLYPHLAPAFRDTFTEAAALFFQKKFGIGRGDVNKAIEAAYRAYEAHLQKVRDFGKSAIAEARSRGLPIFVLAGRPYHADAEINHGISDLIVSLGGVVLSEDCISLQNEKTPVSVLNQWTYHARLFSAAREVTQNEDMQLVQLVSFGCGLDAVTTDEVKETLERGGKFFTQLKIDEINNLGAAKIRLRSLLEAMKASSGKGNIAPASGL